MNEFGAFVKAERKRQSITLRTFTSQLGLSPAYVCSIECGDVVPSLDRIGQIASILACDVGTLMDLAGKTPEYIANGVKEREDLVNLNRFLLTLSEDEIANLIQTKFGAKIGSCGGADEED